MSTLLSLACSPLLAAAVFACPHPHVHTHIHAHIHMQHIKPLGGIGCSPLHHNHHVNHVLTPSHTHSHSFIVGVSNVIAHTSAAQLVWIGGWVGWKVLKLHRVANTHKQPSTHTHTHTHTHTRTHTQHTHTHNTLHTHTHTTHTHTCSIRVLVIHSTHHNITLLNKQAGA